VRGSARVRLPPRARELELRAGRRTVSLTNLGKEYWPELGITKRDLLQYYADVAAVLLPYLRDRAMVMKRYPNGIHGKFFFMKRTPPSSPEWLETCAIMHRSKNLIAFPMVQDLASLLWLVNLGCIDLNPWYARCDDIDRPDYLHFDLDPAEGASFSRVLETALIVRDALVAHGMEPLVKTSGSTGVHIYVGIRRGPLQKEVWSFAKQLAWSLARKHPGVITAEYLIAKRPRGRVLVDYNQNAWGKTLASIYSVRPNSFAGVSTPVTWAEVEHGFGPEEFTLRNVPGRIRRRGDLWKPLLRARGRFPLEEIL
jgi:bifunctional non-homologous end joining protein LigD